MILPLFDIFETYGRYEKRYRAQKTQKCCFCHFLSFLVFFGWSFLHASFRTRWFFKFMKKVMKNVKNGKNTSKMKKNTCFWCFLRVRCQDKPLRPCKKCAKVCFIVHFDQKHVFWEFPIDSPRSLFKIQKRH